MVSEIVAPSTMRRRLSSLVVLVVAVYISNTNTKSNHYLCNSFQLDAHCFTVPTIPSSLLEPQQRRHVEPLPLRRRVSLVVSRSTMNDNDNTTPTVSALKKELLSLLGGGGGGTTTETTSDVADSDDSVMMETETLFVDPITKVPLTMKRMIPSPQLVVGGTSSSKRRQMVEYYSTDNNDNDMMTTTNNKKYVGSSETYINLLEPSTLTNTDNDDTTTNTNLQDAISQLVRPLLPPFLRGSTQSSSSSESPYIPMRDLFTSPTVSYLYERGWRQGFAQAGFPGVDIESIMAYDYLYPALLSSRSSGDTGGDGGTLVDMSCATGLFTRKFLQRALQDNNDDNNDSNHPNNAHRKNAVIRRLIGADYSDAMLREARQRIDNDKTIQELYYNNTSSSGTTRTTTTTPILELVRLDVAKLPMQDDSIDALHAGAAMHCWPEIEDALSEIYRVLRPSGGRYFATTFLANYFRNTQNVRSSALVSTSVQQQTFQFFQSKEEIRALLIQAGFSSNQIQIDIVGRSCVVIRCEK